MTRIVASLLITALLCYGCMPGTKFTGSKFCQASLKEGDQVLVNALPFRNWEYQLDMVRRQMKRRSVSVSYAPEQEWSLRAAGIINPLDSAYYESLIKKGITHLLLIREKSAKQGDSFAYKTPYEASLELNPYLSSYSTQHENSHKVELVMQLFSLRTHDFYSFTVETNVSGVEIRDNDGGSSTVNAGGIDKARNVSIRKGVQRIVKNCE